MNGWVFDGNELEAFYWDGVTDYTKVKEKKEQIEKNIEEFGEWLQKEEKKDES